MMYLLSVMFWRSNLLAAINQSLTELCLPKLFELVKPLASHNKGVLYLIIEGFNHSVGYAVRRL